MLIQFSQVVLLDEPAKQRLRVVANQLLQTNEAQRGQVMFEGKYFHTSDVQTFVSSKRQMLTEG